MTEIKARQHTPEIKERQHTPEIKERQHTQEIKARKHTPEIKERQHTQEIKERQHTPEIKERQHTQEINYTILDRSVDIERKICYRDILNLDGKNGTHLFLKIGSGFDIFRNTDQDTCEAYSLNRYAVYPLFPFTLNVKFVWRV